MTHPMIPRRKFLGSAIAGGIAVATQKLSGQRKPAGRTEEFAITEFELDELTVADLQTAMSSGRYTSRALVE